MRFILGYRIRRLVQSIFLFSIFPLLYHGVSLFLKWIRLYRDGEKLLETQTNNPNHVPKALQKCVPFRLYSISIIPALYLRLIWA